MEAGLMSQAIPPVPRMEPSSRAESGQTSMAAVSCSLKCLERRKVSGVRSAVGMGSLPNNIAVEVEAIFEIAE